MSIEDLISRLRTADPANFAALLDEADEKLVALANALEQRSQTITAINERKSYAEIASKALIDLGEWPEYAWECAQVAALANAARSAFARLISELPPNSPIIVEIMRRRSS